MKVNASPPVGLCRKRDGKAMLVAPLCKLYTGFLFLLGLPKVIVGTGPEVEMVPVKSLAGAEVAEAVAEARAGTLSCARTQALPRCTEGGANSRSLGVQVCRDACKAYATCRLSARRAEVGALLADWLSTQRGMRGRGSEQVRQAWVQAPLMTGLLSEALHSAHHQGEAKDT